MDTILKTISLAETHNLQQMWNTGKENTISIIYPKTGGFNMKKVTEAIWNFFQSLGQAKAAAHFARTGDHKTAQAIMNTR